MCTEVQIVADLQQYVGIIGVAKPAGALDDCLESGRDFGRRIDEPIVVLEAEVALVGGPRVAID